MKPIPYGRQSITEEDISEVVLALKDDFLTQEPRIAKFEKEFAAYVDAKYAVAVSNGTAALHLGALALGLGKGQKIVTTPITFAASSNAALYCGAEVDFVDIDPSTALIDLNKLEEKLKTEKISGVIPVDFAGNPVNTEELRSLANKYNFWIMEDACHAPGAYFTDSKGVIQKSGNCFYSDVSVFSFHPVKHIASGEGGMITTNSKDIYESLLRLRTHGITKSPDLLKENHGGWYYEMLDLGYNYRITDIQAALGNSQLKRAEDNIILRNNIAKKYDDSFEKYGIKHLRNNAKSFNAYHLYVILSSNRKGLYDYLKENNIFAQVHYIPVHLMPYYKELGWKKGDLPNAEAYYEKCLSLPMYPTLTEEEQRYVIEKICSFNDR